MERFLWLNRCHFAPASHNYRYEFYIKTNLGWHFLSLANSFSENTYSKYQEVLILVKPVFIVKDKKYRNFTGTSKKSIKRLRFEDI